MKALILILTVVAISFSQNFTSHLATDNTVAESQEYRVVNTGDGTSTIVRTWDDGRVETHTYNEDLTVESDYYQVENITNNDDFYNVDGIDYE